MRCFTLNWVSVLALLLLPLGGCSGTDDGTGGTGGTGGAAGTGGMAGAGGEAGAGGAAGIGGIGGGSAVVPPGVWIGTGMGGSSGSVDLCFVVNEDGTALTQGTDSEQPCQFWAVEVMFSDCPGFTYKPDIPIVDGSFELILAGTPDTPDREVRGTFDGNTATGEVLSAGDVTCSAQWEASPNE